MMQDQNQDSQQVNNKKLFLGNLPWSLDDDSLKELASEYGEVVDAKVIVDNYSKRSKGFGFVEYSNEEDAAAAVEALNESEVEGRKIFVNIAKPKSPRSDRGGDRGGNRGGRRPFNRDRRSYNDRD